MNVCLISSGMDLIQSINNELRAADQVFALVARVSASGFGQLKKALHEARRQRKIVTVILGVNMISASSPEAIRSLRRLHDGNLFTLLCYNGPQFFHPKLYAFRKGRRWNFLIGSSNLTEEGLASNIELNVLLSGISQSDPFVRSFEDIFSSIRDYCGEFSGKQIDILSDRARKLESKFAQWEKSAHKTSEMLKRRQSIEVAHWNRLIEEVHAFKGSAAYKKRHQSIPTFILACKKTIGKAVNPRVDAKRWNEKKVGYVGSLDDRNYKKTHVTSKKKAERLNTTLKVLLDSRMPIEERLRDTVLLNGRHHIPGMGISHISDILAKYYPRDFPILNNPIIEALRHYGMRHVPSDPVERYLMVCDIYKRMREQSKYPRTFAYLLLDQFMWKKGHKILYGWS